MTSVALVIFSRRLPMPEVPWRAIAGMRDRTIHRYPEVDLDVVWDTLVVDLPNLADRITEFLARTT
jgi:uncharacterized protein with HEPN domain